MALFLIFYLGVGLLLAYENYLTDLEETEDASFYFYRWMPIFWLFILIYNVCFRDRGNDNTGLE